MSESRVLNTALWKCPSVQVVIQGRFGMPQIRTIWLNVFSGSTIQTTAAQICLRFSEFDQLSPTEALPFLEERPETMNECAFSLR